MGAYILRRLLLIIPTLIAIITVNFFIVQVAPGGPIDQMVANMSGINSNMVMERISGQGQMEIGDSLDSSGPGSGGGTAGESGGGASGGSVYRGARGDRKSTRLNSSH